MTKEKLIPPDLKRCQAERKNGSFMSFGLPDFIRCKNKPTHIVTEAPRDDKTEQGSMSLCAKCLVICLKQMPDITIKAIEEN